jgi:hypothetical protein
MELRLAGDQDIAQKLAESMSKATYSQQTLQQVEANLCIKIKELETKLEASNILEEMLKKELEETK